MRAKPAQWGSEGWDHVPETLNRVLSVVMFIFMESVAVWYGVCVWGGEAEGEVPVTLCWIGQMSVFSESGRVVLVHRQF